MSSAGHDIAWVNRTFKDKSTAEALLAPEREIGLVTQHDYDAAVSFLPGRHRIYPFIGTAIGAYAGYSLRRPKWSRPMVASFVIGGSVFGRGIGAAVALFSHVMFVESLEEPTKFAAALDNIRRKEIQAKTDARSMAMNSQRSTSAQESTDPFAQVAPPLSEHRTASLEGPSQPLTSWDRIRIANAKASAQQSSWEAIRQAQGKAELQKRASSTATDIDRLHGDTDRAKAQAEFDAMMERERNYKGDS